MSHPKLEVADIFHRHGVVWRAANKARLSLSQRRVMTAIEVCRTAALGGHVECCEDCAHTRIAYNSCRNRHCPKCQWPAAQAWLAAREAELLPVPYFHVVFTLPTAIGAIAYQNKAKVYGLLPQPRLFRSRFPNHDRQYEERQKDGLNHEQSDRAPADLRHRLQRRLHS